MRVADLALKSAKLLFFACGMIIMLFGLASAYDLKDYYPLEEGDRWTYLATISNGKTDYNEKTVEVNGKETVGDVETVKLLYSNDENECLVNDAEGVKRYKFFSDADYVVFSPSMMLFPANLIVGENKVYTFDSEKVWHKVGNIEDIEGRDRFTGTVQITLESVEDIVVPGGNFTDCLKFSSVYNSKGTEVYVKERCTSWLALGVGLVKEACDVTEFDKDIKGEEKSTKVFELVSVSVHGKNIGK